MLKLHSHPFSIVPWRVRIALHVKNLEYQIVFTDLYTKPATPEFLVLNPFAQIPVLIDDGFVLAESMAILEYLEEKYPHPPLMPKDIQARAIVRKLMCWGTDYWPGAWKKWMAPRFPESLADPWSEESVAQGRREICHHLDMLENQLSDRRWLVSEFSLADICYAPFVLVLDRWVARLKNTQAVTDTMMPRNE